MHIENFKLYNKEGYLKGFCELNINGMITRRCTVFLKNDNYWLGFPSQCKETEEGKKYYPYIKFETVDRSKEFGKAMDPILREAHRIALDQQQLQEPVDQYSQYDQSVPLTSPPPKEDLPF